MGAFAPSRLGQLNAAGDARAMFLKVFGGEVMATFQTATVLDDKQRVRQIESGKSVQFPAIGRIEADYHTPGAEINGSAIKHNERIIELDQLLLASTFVANIDEAMNHYDVRGPYATEIGQSLARRYDEVIGRVIARAARSSQTISGVGFGGSSGAKTADSTFRDANAATNAAILTALLWKAIQGLDEKNVPASDRYIAVKPAQYYLFLSNPSAGASQSPLVIHKDWGGEGNYANGSFVRLGDAMVVKTNNLPSTDLSSNLTAGVTGGNSYAGDFSTTVALVWQKQAVGTVKLMDIEAEMEYSARHQGTLLIGKYAMGHGVLRPECAIEIATAAISNQANLTP